MAQNGGKITASSREPYFSATVAQDARAEDSEEYFDGNDLGLYDPVEVIANNAFLISLSAVLVAGLALLASFLQTPTYTASVKLLVGQQGLVENSSSDFRNLGNEVEGLQKLTETIVEGIRTRPVAEGTIEDLSLSTTPNELLDNVSASQIGASQFIEITYENSSPEQARLVADSIGENFSERISEVGTGANPITARIWEQAAIPTSPSSPNILRNGFLGGALGVMLGIGLAFARELFAKGWKSPEELESALGVPTLCVIPRFEPIPVNKISSGSQSGGSQPGVAEKTKV